MYSINKDGRQMPLHVTEIEIDAEKVGQMLDRFDELEEEFVPLKTEADKVKNKQDKLTAGAGIAIDGNSKISCTVDITGKQDKLTAGEGIAIDANNKISCTVRPTADGNATACLKAGDKIVTRLAKGQVTVGRAGYGISPGNFTVTAGRYTLANKGYTYYGLNSLATSSYVGTPTSPSSDLVSAPVELKAGDKVTFNYVVGGDDAEYHRAHKIYRLSGNYDQGGALEEVWSMNPGGSTTDAVQDAYTVTEDDEYIFACFEPLTSSGANAGMVKGWGDADASKILVNGRHLGTYTVTTASSGNLHAAIPVLPYEKLIFANGVTGYIGSWGKTPTTETAFPLECFTGKEYKNNSGNTRLLYLASSSSTVTVKVFSEQEMEVVSFTQSDNG